MVTAPWPPRSWPNLSPRPANTPKNVLSMSWQSDRSRMKRVCPFCQRVLSRVLKSTLQWKLARPATLIQTRLSATQTDRLTGALLIGHVITAANMGSRDGRVKGAHRELSRDGGMDAHCPEGSSAAMLRPGVAGPHRFV